MEFPKIDHCIYNLTFLRNIELQLVYPRNKNFKEWMHNVSSKWISDGAKPNFSQDEDSLHVSSSIYKLSFKEDKCIMRFNPEHYRSFTSAIELIKANKDLLNSLFGNKVKAARLKKVNVISAEKTNESANSVGLLNDIFSKNLIPSDRYYSEFESSLVAQTTQSTVLQAGYELNINYGFSSNRDNPSQVMGILELVAIDRKPCAFNVFIKNITKMNSIIFDMFNWCVSDHILSLMK